MARENNFLLGQGERLASIISINKGNGDKAPPYEFVEARDNVINWLGETTKKFEALSKEACPNEMVTASLTMHPRYVSKSDFPASLLREVGLKAVGGKIKKVIPKEWGVIVHPVETMTDELLVMGTRNDILRWYQDIPFWTIKHAGADDVMHLENIKAYSALDKVKKIPKASGDILLEVVLHGCSSNTIESFEHYLKLCGSKLYSDKIRLSGGLAFVPIHANVEQIDLIADFSFIRVIRAMPTMRCLYPELSNARTSFPVHLPEMMCLDNSIGVAIFDGGIPNEIELPWVTKIEPLNIGKPIVEYQRHGLAVTSSLLFGPIEPNGVLPQPLCHVDHIRVVDENSGQNGEFEYYDALDRILETIDSSKGKYEFINLSLGPDIPVDDDEITRWTASLDTRLVGGGILATIAAGNSGTFDGYSGLNRVQPPADAVNALSVGACDSVDDNWEKTDYSSVGPGRSPGIVKPDGVIFGGSDKNPFFVLSPRGKSVVEASEGTSLAAPFALRTAVAFRAQIGSSFSPLAIRALMIHRAEQGENCLTDVGWGRFEADYDKEVTCEDDEALVVFQGELPCKDYLRVPIPLPEGLLKGMVTISATLVIAPEVDPGFPNVYTRGGLEVIFRPDLIKFKVAKDGSIAQTPNTKSFFSQKNICGISEIDLRAEGYKWETCLKATQRFQSKSLNQSCFDIYYHRRCEGTARGKAKPIAYAFIVSVKAPKVPDYYARVARTYANVLVPLRPKVRIQITN
ncbi:S8 family peptidase [Anaeroarcus burkinensis]|uniref:S8 family peptidase n=1 Tax=Anaeroarcus burkinensis TaxID=82376 RepID=UPI000409D23F|nr:S8 family peptidase [Anaeroarcus burkinensis]